jgi:hypothetical protein
MDSKRNEGDPKDYKLEFIHDSRRVVTLFFVLCKKQGFHCDHPSAIIN